MDTKYAQYKDMRDTDGTIIPYWAIWNGYEHIQAIYCPFCQAKINFYTGEEEK